MKYDILFVCYGNICRSPTAEAIALQKAEHYSAIGVIDSAGTENFHIGKAPDHRTQSAGAQRGYNLSALRCRQVEVADFDCFDLIVAMDAENLRDLRALAPPHSRAKIVEMAEWLEGEPDVPDPYYGKADGFSKVIDLLEGGVERLFDQLQNKSRSEN